MMQLSGNELLLVNTGSQTLKMKINDLSTVSGLIPNELGELDNVSGNTPTAGDALVWNGVSGEWEPGNVSLDGSLYLPLAGTGSLAAQHPVYGQVKFTNGQNGVDAITLNVGASSVFHFPILMAAGADPTLARHLATKGYVDAVELGDLADVTPSAGAADDGKFLKYNDGSGYELEDVTLADVGIDSGVDGQILTWDTDHWSASDFPTAVEDDGTGTQALGGVIVGEGLTVDADGVLSALVTGAMVLRGTCDLTKDIQSGNENALVDEFLNVNANISTGDVFVNIGDNSADPTATADGDWEQLGGVYQPAANGGELVSYYDNTGNGGGRGWLIVGNASTVILDGYVEKSGSELTGPLTWNSGDLRLDYDDVKIEDAVNKVLISSATGIHLNYDASGNGTGVAFNPDGTIVLGGDSVITYTKDIDVADGGYTVANKAYVDAFASDYLPLVGGTLTGDLRLDNSGGDTKITLKAESGHVEAVALKVGGVASGDLASDINFILGDVQLGGSASGAACGTTVLVNGELSALCDITLEDDSKSINVQGGSININGSDGTTNIIELGQGGISLDGTDVGIDINGSGDISVGGGGSINVFPDGGAPGDGISLDPNVGIEINGGLDINLEGGGISLDPPSGGGPSGSISIGGGGSIDLLPGADINIQGPDLSGDGGNINIGGGGSIGIEGGSGLPDINLGGINGGIEIIPDGGGSGEGITIDGGNISIGGGSGEPDIIIGGGGGIEIIPDGGSTGDGSTINIDLGGITLPEGGNITVPGGGTDGDIIIGGGGINIHPDGGAPGEGININHDGITIEVPDGSGGNVEIIIGVDPNNPSDPPSISFPDGININLDGSIIIGDGGGIEKPDGTPILGSDGVALDELTDVTGAVVADTTAEDGKVLTAKWNGSAAQFDYTFEEAAASINKLDDIADVSVGGASSGDVLSWNGTEWIPAAFANSPLDFKGRVDLTAAYSAPTPAPQAGFTYSNTTDGNADGSWGLGNVPVKVGDLVAYDSTGKWHLIGSSSIDTSGLVSVGDNTSVLTNNGDGTLGATKFITDASEGSGKITFSSADGSSTSVEFLANEGAASDKTVTVFTVDDIKNIIAGNDPSTGADDGSPNPVGDAKITIQDGTGTEIGSFTTNQSADTTITGTSSSDVINIINNINAGGDGINTPPSDGSQKPYLKKGDDVSELINDAGYLTDATEKNGVLTFADKAGSTLGTFAANQASGSPVSITTLTQADVTSIAINVVGGSTDGEAPAGGSKPYLKEGDDVSKLNNDAAYLTAESDGTLTITTKAGDVEFDADSASDVSVDLSKTSLLINDGDGTPGATAFITDASEGQGVLTISYGGSNTTFAANESGNKSVSIPTVNAADLTVKKRDGNNLFVFSSNASAAVDGGTVTTPDDAKAIALDLLSGGDGTGSGDSHTASKAYVQADDSVLLLSNPADNTGYLTKGAEGAGKLTITTTAADGSTTDTEFLANNAGDVTLALDHIATDIKDLDDSNGLLTGSVNDSTVTLIAGTALSNGGSFTTNQSAASSVTFDVDKTTIDSWIDAKTGAITGALVHRGVVDFTQAYDQGDLYVDAPPADGDVYVATATGTVGTGWTGIAGDSVTEGEVIGFGGSSWGSFGSAGASQSITTTADANKVSIGIDGGGTGDDIELAGGGNAGLVTDAERASIPDKIETVALANSQISNKATITVTPDVGSASSVDLTAATAAIAGLMLPAQVSQLAAIPTTYLPLATGGNVSGDINMVGGKEVTGLPDTPSSDDAAASKKYVDSVIPDVSSYLPIVGGTLTGPLAGTSATFSAAIAGQTLSSTGDGTIGGDLVVTGSVTSDGCAITGTSALATLTTSATATIGTGLVVSAGGADITGDSVVDGDLTADTGIFTTIDFSAFTDIKDV